MLTKQEREQLEVSISAMVGFTADGLRYVVAKNVLTLLDTFTERRGKLCGMRNHHDDCDCGGAGGDR